MTFIAAIMDSGGCARPRTPSELLLRTMQQLRTEATQIRVLMRRGVMRQAQ